MTIHITKHASRRLRERIGVPKKSVQGQAGKALRFGRNRLHVEPGAFRKYLDLLWHRGSKYGGATDIIVYANSVYLFAGPYMITMWPLPKKFRERKVIKTREEHDEEDSTFYWESDQSDEGYIEDG